MDEYTFILLAKLKADRRRLEREQRAALRQERPGSAPPARPIHVQHHSAPPGTTGRGFSADLK